VKPNHTQEEILLAYKIADDSDTQPISLVRKLFGFPLMALGFFIIISPFLTSWLFVNMVSPMFLKWQVHNAVALFGGGMVFGVGAVLALGWNVVSKWRASDNGFY